MLFHFPLLLSQTLTETIETLALRFRGVSIQTLAIAITLGSATVILRWILLQIQQSYRNKLKHLEKGIITPNADLQDEDASEKAQISADRQWFENWSRIQPQRETLLFWLRFYWWCGNGLIPAWGIALLFLLFPLSQTLGATLAAALIKLAAIWSGVVFLRNMTHQLIAQYFKAWVRRSESIPDPFLKTRIQLRSTTLTEVFHDLIQLLAWITGILGFLHWNGITLTELLAGTGLLGIAFSFAFKNLLNDWLQGLLVIFEDQYAVGDIIQMGEFWGRVEHISLRRTLLRSRGGRVTTIPHNRLGIVHNRSKDWSRVDFRITIAQDSPLEKAMAIVQEVAETLQQDEVWGKDILSIFNPHTPVSVSKLDYQGIELFIRIKTQRRRFLAVEREYRRRLKLAFDAEDIKIGVPQQSVALTDKLFGV